MAMGKAPSILQIVGYQNSGKTTLVEKVVYALAEQNMKVATIKHHG
ncbi:molybdopterin-guanine dinucleotide biosynthesis protein MobB, partial [Acinetobacter baumannii]|nr:molybdopterin-guanine dinucleotide biosynthesis protein MobB [Acinetobacter baumannii]